MAEIITKVQQNIIIENRERMHVSGVKEVKSFNEEEVCLITELGDLLIKGTELHINSFNVDSKDMSVTGKIIALGYKGTNSSKGIMGKLLK